MARWSRPTLLAPDRFAAILGVIPPHFNQGVSEILFAPGAQGTESNRCSDVWCQYSWQNFDSVSREDAGMAVESAEYELAQALGRWPAPKWIAEEVHPFPRYHRPDLYRLDGQNVRGQKVSLRTNFGKVIAPGQRATTLIDTATVAGGEIVFSDADSDSFNETVTITVATTLTDACEIKAYFAGYSGDEIWEIRPARTKTITGGNVVMTFWAWQLIDPARWERLPYADLDNIAVNLDAAVYVSSVEIRREYNDPTATSATFYWEPQPTTTTICATCLGTGCVQCQLTTQDGCLTIRDANRGLVVPAAATYDSGDGQWESNAFTVCRDPDSVKIWYRCGEIDQRYLSGHDCDPLSHYWAEAIAWLATARLERPFCSCGNSQALATRLREDLALASTTSHNIPFELLSNPFGTLRGEVMAWQRVNRIAPGGTVRAGAI